MAAVAMQSDTKERVDLAAHVQSGRLAWQAPAGNWQVMLFLCVPDGAGGLVDYLDPVAVQKFAALTYDKYYEAFPDHFGKTIDSAFYDEPTFHWVARRTRLDARIQRAIHGEIRLQSGPRLPCPVA